MLSAAFVPLTGPFAVALAVALAVPTPPQSRPLDPALAGLGVAAELGEGDGEARAGGAPEPAEAAPPGTPVVLEVTDLRRVLEPGEPPRALEAADLGCGPRVPACERLTVFGTVTSGIGGAGIAAGAVLLATPTGVIDGAPIAVRDSRRAGTTVMALSISVAITGLLMLWTAARASRGQAARARGG